MASTSGVRLRNQSQIFLVGFMSHQITGCKLPSKRQVLSTLFFNMRTIKLESRSVKLSYKESAKLVIREVMIFWEKARIPTKLERNALRNLDTLYESWQSMQKISTKGTDHSRAKLAEFASTIDDLFDIASQDALVTMTIEEDKEFLQKQRQKGRQGCMIGIDMRLTQAEERKSERLAIDMKRRVETFQFDYGK
uniref:Uncharacterized protein n=1 Tax=Cacopsylla melanoneura TaxID=428564 RepID=A0A8D8VRR8_9HEMI